MLETVLIIFTLPRGAPLPLQFVYNCTATVDISWYFYKYIYKPWINPVIFFAESNVAVFYGAPFDDWAPFFGQFGKNCTMKPWEKGTIKSAPRFKQQKQSRKPQKKKQIWEESRFWFVVYCFFLWFFRSVCVFSEFVFDYVLCFLIVCYCSSRCHNVRVTIIKYFTYLIP